MGSVGGGAGSKAMLSTRVLSEGKRDANEGGGSLGIIEDA